LATRKAEGPVDAEKEPELLSRREQEKLVLALRLACAWCQKRGIDFSPYQEMLGEASIGLPPKKLGQVYNLLKAIAGFEPLGHAEAPETGERAEREGTEASGTSSLQDLRRRIYDKAKSDPKLRFRALYVHVTKPETLQEAYRLAKKNDGAPGIDGVTFEAIEKGGLERFLGELRDELVKRRYKPQRNRKKEIPKGGGKVRTLGIPTIRDRVVQGALKLILEPIFEADFQPGSCGYRPEKTAHEAVHRVKVAIAGGGTQVIDLDLKAFFDNVRHDLLLEKVAQRVQDKDVLHLLKLILKASGKKGVPQGGVISPLLSNLYLTEVDKMLERAKEVTKEGTRYVVEYARYADDLVVLLGDRPRDAWLRWAVPKRLREELAKLRVELNEEKSRMVDLRKDEGFGFLGFDIRRVHGRKGQWRLQMVPKLKKRTELLGKLREVFWSHRSQPVQRVVAEINPILRGWVNYFRIGNASRSFSYVKRHVELKVRQHLMRAKGRKGYGWKRWSTAELVKKLGLFNQYRLKPYEPRRKALAGHAVP
jgi:RNA-directed DNA polymerase